MPRRAHHRPRTAALVVVAALVTSLAAACATRGDEGDLRRVEGAAAGAVERSGELADGTTWRLRAPDDWNGTLLLYSRGSVPPGAEHPALVAPDRTTEGLLLDRGFALVGSSYAEPGWVLASAVAGQPDLLDLAAEELGAPERVVAWGHSLGGLVTVALAETHADDLDGALAACGIVGGPEALWDPFLDIAFVLRTLLIAPDRPVELVAFEGSPALAERQLREAASRSVDPTVPPRVALAAAVAAVPTWAPGAPSPPAAEDRRAQLLAQAVHLASILPMATTFRADMERHVGGNPSSNVGVDYGALLSASPARSLVEAEYAAAGLDLDADLATLAAAPRVRSDQAAARALVAPADLTGDLDLPVLTLHGSADGLALPSHARAYGEAVADAGRADLLRQVVVERPGHCAFTAAEQLAALDALLERIETGRWPDTSATALDAAARALGPAANVLTNSATTTPDTPAFADATLPRSPRAAAGQPQGAGS